MKKRISQGRTLKLGLVCSAGGHLVELTRFGDCYRKYPHFFITHDSIDTRELKKTEIVHIITDPGRSPRRFVRSVLDSLRAVMKERPDVIISTGGGIAVAPCFIAKALLGTKVVYVESFCRVKQPSVSGRLVYPIADMFLVQWKDLLMKYGDKAEYRGAVF